MPTNKEPYRCIYCGGPCNRVHFGMDGVTRYQCRDCLGVSGSYRLPDTDTEQAKHEVQTDDV